MAKNQGEMKRWTVGEKWEENPVNFRNEDKITGCSKENRLK